MIDLNLGDALMHTFKERRWWLKLGIISSLSFVVTILTLFFERISKTTINADSSIRTLTSVETSTAIIIVVSSLVVGIIYTFFAVWYQYENTQAAIQNRDTRLIWEYSLGASFKRVIKYFLTNILYAITTFVFATVFVFIPAMVMVFLLAMLSPRSNVALHANGYGDGSIMFAFIFLAVCLLALIALFIAVFVIYAATSSGYLRLYATNTFAEAFNISANLKVAKKYFWYFVLVAFMIGILELIPIMLSMISSVIVAAISVTHPNWGLLLQAIFQIPLTLLTTYITLFVSTRLLGTLYKEIIKREDDLKFLRK